MADDKAVLVNAHSTLEQVASMPDAPETVANTNNDTQSNIIVTPEGNLENNVTAIDANAPAPTPTEQPIVEQEENTSTFEIPAFDETPPQEQVAPQPKYVSWEDAIEGADKKAVLKKLGLDDFELEFYEFRKNGGDPYKYLEARSFDWNKVPDSQVIKEELKQQYPTLSEDKIQRIYDAKYKQSDFVTDEEREVGLIQMEADAANARQRRIDEQKKFQITSIEQPKQEQLPQNNQQDAEEAQKLINHYRTHESTKSLLESKRVAIDVGAEKPFNFKIDNPQNVWDVLFKDEVQKKYLRTKTGEPDVQLAYELALYTMNPTQFKKDIYNAGVMAGNRKQLEKGLNAAIPNQQMPPAPNETERDAWKTRVKTGTLGGN